MFTGIIDAVGKIKRVHDSPAGRELVVAAPYDDLADGESIAINGACLTVRDRERGTFTVAAVETTLRRTSIGAWKPGLRVNLERALKLDSRLGGHIVQGHVDCVGRVLDARADGDARLVDIWVPCDVVEILVPLGPVAVDGVSLTVNAIAGPEAMQVSLVDYTLHHTTLRDLEPGMPVHVEADIIAKYVQRLAAPYRATPGQA